MTKRRPKKHKSAMYSIVDGVAVDVPHSATILVTGSPDEDTYLALQEQRYEMLAGRDAIARSLAAELRRDSPCRAFLDMVARMVDPESDDYFKLVVSRARNGKTWTRRANNAALAKAVTYREEVHGNRHGDQKKAVAEVAERYEVSKATVLKALRSSNSNAKIQNDT
jgi:hypothetical protein